MLIVCVLSVSPAGSNMTRILPTMLLLSLLLLTSVVSACKCRLSDFYTLIILYASAQQRVASAASFCKCICGANSTIISLNNARRPPSADGSSSTSPRTCNDCNRQFCLDYKLPICKGTKDEEISTECFRELSRGERAAARRATVADMVT